MTKEEIIAKIKAKEDKIVAMTSATGKTRDLLRDIRVLYDEHEKMSLEEAQPVAETTEQKTEVKKPKIEPMHFCIPQSEVVDEFDMGACAVVKTRTGYEWRAKGGFRMYTENTNESLSGAMESFFEMRDQQDVLSPKEIEDQEQIMTALTYILNYPMIAFSDPEFMIKMATEIVKWMKERYDELMAKPLHDDDDPEATRDFQQATLAIEELKGVTKNAAEKPEEE